MKSGPPRRLSSGTKPKSRLSELMAWLSPKARYLFGGMVRPRVVMSSLSRVPSALSGGP